jgi:hypothetical protein
MGVGVRVIVDGRTGYGFEELVREMVVGHALACPGH